MDARKIFSENLKFFLEAYNLEYVDVAKALKMRQDRLLKYINGEEYPQKSEIVKIADLFDVPATTFTVKRDEVIGQNLSLLFQYEDIDEDTAEERYSLSPLYQCGYFNKKPEMVAGLIAKDFGYPMELIKAQDGFFKYVLSIQEKLVYLFGIDSINLEDRAEELQLDKRRDFFETDNAFVLLPRKRSIERLLASFGIEYTLFEKTTDEVFLRNLFYFCEKKKIPAKAIAEKTGLPMHCLAGYFDDEWDKNLVVDKIARCLGISATSLIEAADELNQIEEEMSPQNLEILVSVAERIRMRKKQEAYAYEKDRLNCIHMLSCKMSDLPKVEPIIPFLQNLAYLNVEKSSDEEFYIEETTKNYKEKLKAEKAEQRECLVSSYFWGKLSSIRSVQITGCGLRVVPKWIRKQTQLECLKMSDNLIDGLPSWITELSKLKVMDFDKNNLHKIPDDIGKLRGLNVLHMSQNRINKLPDSILDIKKLRVIDISRNTINELPEWIGTIKGLECLDLSRLKINKIPYSLVECKLPFQGKKTTNHDWLGLNSHRLSSVRNIGNLISQKVPGMIGKTELGVPVMISGSFAGGIASGSSLRTSIEDYLAEMKNPYISHQYEEYVEEVLKEFKVFIEKTFAPSEKKDFVQQYLMKGILIEGISIRDQDPAIFIDNNRFLIQNWYHEHNAEKMVTIKEAKVIFLGDGDAGKTYSIRRLLRGGEKETEETENQYKTDVTYGINIQEYDSDPRKTKDNIKLRIWDFGGQAIMHSMHRCFLTNDTCYVLVISTRNDRDQMEQARYWLRNVKSFAGNAPVLIYVNRWDRMSDRLDTDRLMEEFPENLLSERQFVFINAKKDEKAAFLELKNSIVATVKNYINYNRQIPKTWNDARNALTDLARKDGKFCIDEKEYFKICEENDIVLENSRQSKKLQKELLSLFNILGICFSYHVDRKNTPIKDYKVLNPEWLTNAIYLLITKGAGLSDYGLLKNEFIETILKNPQEGESGNIAFLKDVEYGEQECKYIREVMRKFKLSYTTTDGEFIPALCSGNRPKNLVPVGFDPNVHQHVTYFIHYEYLPDTVLQQLIVANREYRNFSEYWGKGVCIRLKDLGLTIIMDMGNGKDNLVIDIYATGNVYASQVLPKFRNQIMDINEELGISGEEYITGYMDEMQNDFKVRRLLNLKRKGRQQVDDENGELLYPIDGLLNQIYGEEHVKAIPMEADNPMERLNYSLAGAITPELDETALTMSVREALLSLQDQYIYHLKNDKVKRIEDPMNDYVASILNVSYITKKQSRGGRSSGGQDSGSRDIVIGKGKDEIAIYEGLVLDSRDSKEITKHADKLIKYYNSIGLPYLYLVVYYRGKSLMDFWEKFYGYMSAEYEMPYPVVEKFEEKPEKNAMLRYAKSTFRMEGKPISMYIFAVNMEVYQS